MTLKFNPYIEVTIERINKHIFSQFTIGVNNYQLVFFMASYKNCNFGIVWETPRTLNCGEHYIMWRGGIQ